MEKRAFIAVVLSLLVLILYQAWMGYYYGTPPPSPPEEEKVKEVARPEPKPTPGLAEVKSRPSPPERDIKEIRVETDHYVAIFTNHGARLKSFTLKHYRASVDKNGPSFEMISAAPGSPYPLGLGLQGAAPFVDGEVMYSVKGSDLRLTGDAKGTLRFEGQIPSGEKWIKEFTFSGSGYPMGLELSVEGAGRNGLPSLLVTSQGKSSSPDAVFEGLLALVAGKLTREWGEGLFSGMNLSGAVSWAGFGYTYFIFALLPEDGGEQELSLKPAQVFQELENLPPQVRFPDSFKDRIEYDAAKRILIFRGLMSAPEKEELLNLSQDQTYRSAVDALYRHSHIVMGIRDQQEAGKSRYTLFIGPKDLDILKSLGKELERSIDFGYFAFVSMPLLYLLRFFHNFTGNYGIDIIFLTVLIKLLTAPLTHKSFVSMKRMQKLQPQMERIKEKFKDDREKLNKEIMELYRRNKVNPLGGCLPMLLQFPVFIGLYNALLTPIELRHASFLWIKDLSQP
ncbi:MAG: membrane protein insertase YidC, partial [Candidatus Binatia bacterium]